MPSTASERYLIRPFETRLRNKLQKIVLFIQETQMHIYVALNGRKVEDERRSCMNSNNIDALADIINIGNSL